MDQMREHMKSILLSVLTAWFILLVVSPDSYTHDLFGRGDSAWYFLCGKSWMNGLTPYVDFSDSKGPLLWLIYGIGYLLSPRTYLGIFWLSVCFYAVTFYFTYRTAHLFLGRRMSWIATALMAFAYFNPLLHYEIRCEDYCLMPMVISLYIVCNTFYNRHTSRQRLNNRALLLGICFGMAVMIKFNIALMLAIFPIAFLAYAWKRKHGFWRLLSRTLAGIVLIIAPFIVWLAMDGALNAFLYEYFVLTFKTTQNWTDGSLFFFGFLSTHTWLIALPLFAITLTGVLLMRRHLIRWTFFPLVAFIWVFLLCMQNATCNYYYCSASPFLLFLVVSLLKIPPEPVRERLRRLSVPIVIVLTLVCAYVNYEMNDKIGNLFYQDNADRKEYYDIAATMMKIANKKQEAHPTVVYFCVLDAYDMPSEALPGCKYFGRQDGELPFMTDTAKEACRRGTTDFVVAASDDAAIHAFLDSCGYFKVADSHIWGRCLYAHEACDPLPESWHVSNSDVLMKRRIEVPKQ